MKQIIELTEDEIENFNQMNLDVERNKVLMEQKSVSIGVMSQKDKQLVDVLQSLVKLEPTLVYACSETKQVDKHSITELNKQISS